MLRISIRISLIGGGCAALPEQFYFGDIVAYLYKKYGPRAKCFMKRKNTNFSFCLSLFIANGNAMSTKSA